MKEYNIVLKLNKTREYFNQQTVNFIKSKMSAPAQINANVMSNNENNDKDEKCKFGCNQNYDGQSSFTQWLQKENLNIDMENNILQQLFKDKCLGFEFCGFIRS